MRVTPWDEPFERFASQLKELAARRTKNPNAMVLSTADAKGRPSSRVVLLKGFSSAGFVFFTNYQSRKGRELARGFAGLCFYWPELDRQVRVEGKVKKVSAKESEAYFATRHRLSQIGAWASQQSEVLETREALEARVHALEQKFEGGPVPRPKHWGGYLLKPEAIELWEARENRLHVRERYSRRGKKWALELLNP